MVAFYYTICMNQHCFDVDQICHFVESNMEYKMEHKNAICKKAFKTCIHMHFIIKYQRLK